METKAKTRRINTHELRTNIVLSRIAAPTQLEHQMFRSYALFALLLSSLSRPARLEPNPKVAVGKSQIPFPGNVSHVVRQCPSSSMSRGFQIPDVLNLSGWAVFLGLQVRKALRSLNISWPSQNSSSRIAATFWSFQTLANLSLSKALDIATAEAGCTQNLPGTRGYP